MARRSVPMAPAARNWYLAEICYLAQRNPDAAARVIEMMRVARSNLSDYPRIGRKGIIPGTSHLVVGDYVLTLRFREETLEIVAIRHARQGDAFDPEEAHAKDEELPREA